MENNCGITSQPHQYSALKAISVSAVAQTPIDPIQQHLDQHTLMKQVSLIKKQFALLRENQANNPQAIQTLPMENVTNVLNNVSNV